MSSPNITADLLGIRRWTHLGHVKRVGKQRVNDETRDIKTKSETSIIATC